MHIWRERLSRWFEAPARRCPFSPNAISLIALALNVSAAAAMAAGGTRPILFLVAVVLLAIGGLADAFDGIVARVQGKASPFGDFLDHLADRVSDTAVAIGWMIGSGVGSFLAILATAVVMWNGYAGTQIEATWRERNYDTVGRGEFVLALIIYPIISYTLATNGWLRTSAGGLTIPDWMTIAMIAAGAYGIGQRIALAMRLERSR